jgi:hypothetical protein
VALLVSMIANQLQLLLLLSTIFASSTIVLWLLVLQEHT